LKQTTISPKLSRLLEKALKDLADTLKISLTQILSAMEISLTRMKIAVTYLDIYLIRFQLDLHISNLLLSSLLGSSQPILFIYSELMPYIGYSGKTLSLIDRTSQAQ